LKLSGRAWVCQTDGVVTELRLGAIVPSRSEVVTGSGTMVTLAIDGAAPITIGENRSVAITDDLAASVDPGEVVVTLRIMADLDYLLTKL